MTPPYDPDPYRHLPYELALARFLYNRDVAWGYAGEWEQVKNQYVEGARLAIAQMTEAGAYIYGEMDGL